MSKRLVTDQDEIYELILADPAFTEAVSRNDKGVYITGADGTKRYITQLEMEDDDLGETSDGYHTFNELYEFRLLYNAALFNEWAKQKLYDVHKSWHHADAPNDSIFGKGWFVVYAELPTGQISNHYAPEHWILFNVPETPTGATWDGHSAEDVAKRLRSFLVTSASLADIKVNMEESYSYKIWVDQLMNPWEW